MSNMRTLYCFLIVLGTIAMHRPASAQTLWHEAPAGQRLPKKLQLAANAVYAQFEADDNEIMRMLNTAAKDRTSSTVITLPTPDGQLRPFKVWRSALLPATLAAKYPSLKTYDAQATDAPWITAKLDIGPDGLHAMVYDGNRTFLIGKQTSDEVYTSHYRNDERQPFEEHMKCEVAGHETADVATLERNKYHLRTTNGDMLRSYRLALSCDHQYAQAVTDFPFPTKEQVLSKMVTTINRINGVYERELSVTLTFVDAEDTLIFVDSTGDPLGAFDQSAGALLNYNQTLCDDRIGSANYDIGHVFSTGGGGQSQISCVCQDGQKAKSVTGSKHPTGDAFDIDYVAHEMGHEFGSEHTFNNNLDGSCFGNASAECAFQPGSGSTIMDYAGICKPDDIQPHSDAYFSGSSLLQIHDFITDAGNTCAVKTPTGNQPVAVPAFTASYAIPFLTPFELTAPSVNDTTSDSVSYCWEQWNLGDFGRELIHTYVNGPIFRSFTPVSSPTRIFPNIYMVLSDSLSNAGTENAEGEKAPDSARFLTFRVTVRNMLNGTGAFVIPDDTVHLDAINTGSGFRVTSQDQAGKTYASSTQEMVTWEVVNTNLPPISTDSVDIYLSVDGGYNWPFNLGRYANTGSATITIPAVPDNHTEKARIKVKGTNNVFFNVNRHDFTIVNYPGHTGDVEIFPSPAHNTLHVFTGAAGTVTASIYNVAGKVMWSDTIIDILELDVTSWPRGMYFFRMGNSSFPTTTKKFIVR